MRIFNPPASSSGPSPATTVVSETSAGQSPAVGTSLNYAREDHTHGTPSGGGAGSDPMEGLYAPGSFTLETGKYSIMAKSLQLSSTQRATIEGDGRLVIL